MWEGLAVLRAADAVSRWGRSCFLFSHRRLLSGLMLANRAGRLPVPGPPTSSWRTSTTCWCRVDLRHHGGGCTTGCRNGTGQDVRPLKLAATWHFWLSAIFSLNVAVLPAALLSGLAGSTAAAFPDYAVPVSPTGTWCPRSGPSGFGPLGAEFLFSLHHLEVRARAVSPSAQGLGRVAHGLEWELPLARRRTTPWDHAAVGCGSSARGGGALMQLRTPSTPGRGAA